ncbi:MAG: hypothetical protein QQW96_00165 [Tychonema bourrellyi B0820]|uniref:hypothetical protein n=1 Tax=Tychonema bourrellyi TaxID=54313 RepID=UPI001FECAD8A|nr:hypothetical protein [Tychonema bourrellyi]MDQ2096053.1 hypothetical protein [Tychonema bourrellyi B0820]
MNASTRITAGIPASQKLSAHCLDGYAAPVHPDIRRKQPGSQVPKLLWTILRI